jgi:hypothetical protein
VLLGTGTVLGLSSGFFCGFLMWLVGRLNPIKRADLFNDRNDWHLPSDYEYVVVKDEDDNNVEMEDISGISGSHIRALKSKQVQRTRALHLSLSAPHTFSI